MEIYFIWRQLAVIAEVNSSLEVTFLSAGFSTERKPQLVNQLTSSFVAQVYIYMAFRYASEELGNTGSLFMQEFFLTADVWTWEWLYSNLCERNNSRLVGWAWHATSFHCLIGDPAGFLCLEGEGKEESRGEVAKKRKFPVLPTANIKMYFVRLYL